MMGDRRDLALSESDMTTIANAKKAGIPVLLCSSRAVHSSSTARWSRPTRSSRPGCRAPKAWASADVLFGDYKPTGIAAAAAAYYDPLFPFGFGLTF